MPSDELDEKKALLAVDSRPVSAQGLGVLLNLSSDLALALVTRLVSAGLVKSLNSMHSANITQVQTKGEVPADAPLTLTFRGYLKAHPLFRKVN